MINLQQLGLIRAKNQTILSYVNKKMILITSAAYVNSEFQTEFGRLPLCFLPIGNRRLFDYQLEFLRKTLSNHKVFISLPGNFLIPIKDTIYFDKCDVKILRSDQDISLGESIAQALGLSGISGEALYLLHGDKLVEEVPTSTNVIGIVKTDKDYKWEGEAKESASEDLWCGFFSFESVDTFKRLLDQSNNHLINAVRSYATEYSVKNVWIDGLHDLGHVNTYFLSRSKLTTQRSFNALTIVDGCVKKTGNQSEKIKAEYTWFANVPTKLKRFCPQLIDAGTDALGQAFYINEYLPLPPLNEVFVHGTNPIFYWDKVFSLCSNFLEICHQFDRAIDVNALGDNDLAGSKTWQRLEAFCNQSNYPGIDAPNVINGKKIHSIRTIVHACVTHVGNDEPILGILHGDFCFSNILFDSRMGNIKVVDPRGLSKLGLPLSHGDLRYDLAKLTHSVIGLYDFIMAGAFDLKFTLSQEQCSFDLLIHADERVKSIQDVYMSHTFFANTSARSVIPLTVLLFLSMLPLHSDDKNRQMALLANAMRLYSDFIE